MASSIPDDSDQDRLATEIAFDRAQDGLLLVDQFGRVKRANFAAEVIVGSPVKDIENVDRIFGSRTRRVLVQTAQRGASQFDAMLSNGTFVDVRVTLVDSSPVLLLFALRDGTALLVARAEQKRLVALADRRRRDELGALVSGIAHDFNNLLTPILSNSEVLLDEADDDNRAIIDDMRLAATLAAQLVSNIRILNREPTGAPTTHAASSLRDCQQLVASDDAFAVEWYCDVPDIWDAAILATDLNRVILNLVKNARDACEGLGRCSISASVAKCDSGTDLVLEIEDNGPGIPSEIVDRIFDAYFTTKTRERGTGLGLAIVRALLNHAGGSIVVSTSNDGTCFTVRLPLTEGSRKEPKPSFASPKKSLHGLRVLLVDDDPSVLRAFKRLLTRAGATVTADSFPARALERLESGDQFDLVITDYLMPEITGVEVAAAVMRHSPSTPVVLCSGHIGSDADRSAIAASIRLVLSKPIAGTEFIEKVASVI